jgi:hypothetical protein
MSKAPRHKSEGSPHGQPERRRHQRYELECPIRLSDASGRIVAQTRTENLSDGGAFVGMSIEDLPPLTAPLAVKLSVPRTTPNTRMLEEFSCGARVVRHHPFKDERVAGVGLAFDEPLELMLDA